MVMKEIYKNTGDKSCRPVFLLSYQLSAFSFQLLAVG